MWEIREAAGMARDVFISYRSEDKEAANRICAALERENVSCWIAPRDIGIGREWATAIVEGLQRSKSFVLVLSSNSKNARQISREAELADRQGLPIVTFRIEDVQPPPELLYFLGNIQWLDAFDDQFDSAIARLRDVVRQSASYPAEKSGMHAAVRPETAPPVRTDEPAPQANPVPRPVIPARPETKENNSARWIAIAAGAIVVLGLGGWLLTRHPHPKPEPRTVAEKFIRERDSGNFDAAWSATAPGFNDGVREQVWVANVQNHMRRNGKVQRLTGGCQPAGSDYTCQFTASYENGRSSGDTVTLKAKDDGSWGVWRSDVQAKQ